MKNKKIEEAKECLKETIQNTYAEGKAIKLNNILQYIDQLETKVKELGKENEELLEVKISAAANNRIEKLTRENFKLKTELENKRKEYQDTYKDIKEELKELKIKSNKYDSLAEKIQEYCRTNIEQLNSGEILSIRAILKDILELLDEENRYYKEKRKNVNITN